MEFEWDPDKATGNLRKHRVSFYEAATVFGDFFGATAVDPGHSVDEHRYITVGLSNRGRLLIVAHTERRGRKGPMKKRGEKMSDELRPEYDLKQILKGGVRGKYAKRYHAGSNLVLLDPDVRKSFRNEKAVNDALRLVIALRKIGSGSAREQA